MKKIMLLFFTLSSISMSSQNMDASDSQELDLTNNMTLPDVESIKPNQIIVYDKTYKNKLYEFEVHYVYEEEIYAKANQLRMRVIAFLYPKLIKEYEGNKVFVLGFTGGRIDSSIPSPSLFSVDLTSNYSIIGKKQNAVSYNKIGFSKLNLTKHIILRHPSHVPYEAFWGYGLADSKVLGTFNSEVYRVDSILLPAILSETDIDLGGVGIKCFAHPENKDGVSEFIKGIVLRDDKILSVQN